MVSGSSGHLRTTLGAPRYQALWWDMEGITMVSGGSATLPDRLRTTEIPSTLVGHGGNHDGIWSIWIANSSNNKYHFWGTRWGPLLELILEEII